MSLILTNDYKHSSAAPKYRPKIWNDLPIDAKENVRLFFAEMRAKHMGASLMLQSSGLFYLGALVSLLAREDRHLNTNAQRIKSLIAPEEVREINLLMIKYFSHQQTRANCFSYMLDFMKGSPGSKPDPGAKTQEYKCGRYSSYYEAVVAGAIEESLVHAGSHLPPVKSEFYRAALFIKESDHDPSFHWMREDFEALPESVRVVGSEGISWSHKDGHGPVKNVDYKGERITNPQTAALGNYEFADYFYVPKHVVPKFEYGGL